MHRQPNPPATLSAVAQLAGVSVATVSYVLNEVRGKRIPESTRVRVRQAAAELGYVPNATARSLRAGRSDLVVAHVPGGVPMLQRAAAGLERVGSRLREAGFRLMVDIESALSGQQAARHWSALRPAVLLTNAGFLDDAGLAQLHAAGTTVVAIAHASQKQKLGSLPTIVFDDSMIGEVAVQHLIDRGCREITLIQPEHPATSPLARQRKVGAQRAARRTKSVRLSTASMGLSTGSAAKLASSWTRGHCPDGVFGFDDSHAGLLLSAMIDHGLRVPQQVALVGSDNSEVCEMLRPKLTSTAIDTEDLAASLVDPVLRALQGTWREGLAEAPWKASLYKRDT